MIAVYINHNFSLSPPAKLSRHVKLGALSPEQEVLEMVYTFQTWLACFPLASDTRGDDLKMTGDRWSQLQV